MFWQIKTFTSHCLVHSLILFCLLYLSVIAAHTGPIYLTVRIKFIIVYVVGFSDYCALIFIVLLTYYKLRPTLKIHAVSSSTCHTVD